MATLFSLRPLPTGSGATVDFDDLYFGVESFLRSKTTRVSQRATVRGSRVRPLGKNAETYSFSGVYYPAGRVDRESADEEHRRELVCPGP